MTDTQAQKAAQIIEDDGGCPRIEKDGYGGYKVYDFDTNTTYYELLEVTNPQAYSQVACDGPSDADSGL